MSFKIAAIQFCPIRKNIKANISKIRALLSGVEADLIVLPELANSGYLYEAPQALQPFSENKDGMGFFLSEIRALAKLTKSIIVTGYSEIDGTYLYNSACAVSAEGVLENYRKTHLFADEKSLFQPGNSGFKTFYWRGVKIGMMICFDWIFPESARTLSLAGAQIIAHPANLVLPYCQDAMVTRSIENRVFTITANRVGEENLGQTNLRFTGSSQITSPKGEILYRAPKTKTAVHVADINPMDASDKSISVKNDLFADRRPEMYSIKK